eukprot:TRINITY_DN21569_c0_g1_i1.p1 TRINITY_DN21569_c0_g1~~TRINITY_DN21569_c0_g1_i1.p1  ORF type:complete len:903 (+),score=191.53 TRINITY_DN21569_c0_g1_i1:117-2825(+)
MAYSDSGGLSSPVSRWIQAPTQPTMPQTTKVGLRGRDPELGLDFVNISDLTPKQQKAVPNHRKVFINKDTNGSILYTLIYFFGIITKASHGRSLSQQKRLAVVGQQGLYILYINTAISRCIPLTDIEEIVLSPDCWVGINVSGAHDVAFKVETALEKKQLVSVLQTMCQHASGRPLHVQRVNGTQTTVKSKMSLQKQPNWSSKNSEVVPLVAVTKEQLESAMRCGQQSVKPDTPVAERGFSAFADVDPAPEDPERKTLLQKLSHLVQETDQLSKLSSESDNTLQSLKQSASSVIKTRTQLCSILGIENPSDNILRLSLTCKTRDKLSQIAGIKNQWKNDLSLIRKQLQDEMQRTSHIDIANLQNQLKKNGVPSTVWDEHLELANNIRELVAKIEVLKNASEGLLKQQSDEKESHEDRINEMNKSHTSDMNKLHTEIANIKNQIAEQEASLSPAVTLAKKRQKELNVTKQGLLKAISETSSRIHHLESLDIHPAEEQPEVKSEAATVAEELQGIEGDLQRANNRCASLQEVASEGPSILHELEMKEAEIQRLEFESRELMIKGKSARQQYESSLSNINMNIETVNNKVSQLDAESTLLQDEANASLKAATEKYTAELEEAQQLLASAKASYQEEATQLANNEESVSHYYNQKLQYPYQECSDDQAMEKQLSAIDEAILKVHDDLVVLDKRDLTVRSKFEKNEATMLAQRDVLSRNISVWKAQGNTDLVTKAQEDLEKLQETIDSLQRSMNTFASHARITRDKHHQREQVLMSKRDSLCEAVAEANKQNMAILIETSTLASEFSSDIDTESVTARQRPVSPLAPTIPSWLHPVTVTRHSSNELWGLSCDGTVITTVVAGSPVDRAGLQLGQTIVMVGDVTVHTQDQIYAQFTSANLSVSLVIHD